MSNWIEVNDRLPGEEESVLVFQDGNDVCDYLIIQACLFDGCFYADHMNGLIDYEDRLDVTHWQPLPEPPQGN